MTKHLNEILTFLVDDQRFAIPLQTVDCAIRAVAITRLTDSPGFIEGVIDYYGEIIAVINMRKRLSYSLHELNLNDRLIIVHTTKRKLALLVDHVEDVIVPDSQDLFESKDLDAGLKLLSLLRDDKGIVLIYDLENLLSKTEEIQLKEMIEADFTPNNDV